MKKSKFKLIRVRITNNEIFKLNLGLDELDIDMTKKDFIGIIGDNGVGKSTFLNCAIPVPFYGVWIPKVIGKQELWYSNDNVSFHLIFNFEPNDDKKHSCKGYFYETNLETGDERDLNPNGSFDNMLSIIDEKLGVNKNILKLFNIVSDNIFLVDLTTGERLQFIQNILKGLARNKKRAIEINTKLLVVNKALKANENKLSRMNSEEYMKDTIIDMEESLKRLEKEYTGLAEKKKKYEQTISELKNLKEEKAIIDTRVDSITNIFTILNSEYLIEYAMDEISIDKILDKIKTDIEYINYDVENNERKLSSLEGEISSLETKEKISFNYSNEEYSKLSNYFSDFSQEDLRDIMSRDLDELQNVVQILSHLKEIRNNILSFDISISDVIDTADKIMDDHMYVIKIKEENAILKREKIQELKDIEATLVKTKVFKELNRNFKEPDIKICDTCSLYNKVRLTSDDYDILSDKARILEEEIENISSTMNSDNILFEVAGMFINAYNNIIKQEYMIKSYIADFEFNKTLIKDGLIDSMISRIQSLKKDKIDLQQYKKMKEMRKIEQDMKGVDDISLDRMKANKKQLLESLDKASAAKEDILKKDKYIKRSIIAFDSNDRKVLLYKPKFELREIIHSDKIKRESISSKIKDLEHDLESFEDGYSEILFDRIEREKASLDKIKGDLLIRNNIVTEIVKLGSLRDELEAIYITLSDSLVKKVVRNFMYNLKEYTNSWLKEIGVPYRIMDIDITDKDFTIPVLNERTSKILPDISMMSSGEKALVGITLVFAAQLLLDLPYNTIQLDEVDAKLSPVNKRKFITTVSNLVSRDKKQAIVISHAENFTMDNSVGLIGLLGADLNYPNEYLFKYKEA